MYTRVENFCREIWIVKVFASARDRESRSLSSLLFLFFLVCHVGENTFIGEHGPG